MFKYRQSVLRIKEQKSINCLYLIFFVLNTPKSNTFENLETYKDLFDNAHDLIHIVHLDGTIIYVNKAWMDVLGYSHEEIQGQSIYSFIEEQDRSLYIEYRETIIKGNTKDKEITIGLLPKNGSRIKVEGFVSTKIIEGTPLYTRGIFRDVTEKLQNEARLKLANEELKEREANLQQLLFYAPDAIVVIDRQSIVTYWNPKAEAVFGWSAEEVVGKCLTQIIIPPRYREAHTNGMNRYLTTGEVRVLNKTIEITALNKKGKEFYVSLTISTTSQKGKIAFIAFIRDIDEQKRNALELEQKKADLERSNAELEQFAHVASHDLKEPVRKVRTFSKRIKDEFEADLPDKVKIYVHKIESAASRMSDMINGVLLYSSINVGAQLAETIDLEEIIRNIENDLEIVIQQKEAVIEYGRLPVIEGLPVLIYQLFYNLISNSLKFSKQGTAPLIKIAAKNAQPDDIRKNITLPIGEAYVQIEVQDNGIGFNQKEAEKIFKTFTRLNSKDDYEGTGLGLALCRKVVERHGGWIGAEGIKGEGARFKILLPQQSHL